LLIILTQSRLSTTTSNWSPSADLHSVGFLNYIAAAKWLGEWLTVQLLQTGLLAAEFAMLHELGVVLLDLVLDHLNRLEVFDGLDVQLCTVMVSD